jgi:lipopolysaccharide/colanic/teichoic acid biosynthesis glycosyltransferase
VPEESREDAIVSTSHPEIDEVATSSLHLTGWTAGWYRAVKPVVDFALAAVMLVITAPVILLAFIMVRVTSRGPWLYTQKRLGLNGTVFTLYKIRTMYLDSERKSGPVWCVPGDPRVTQVGRLLRSSHFDELPQLVNVLRGEMSLVGPRPERPEFLAQLERALPNYRGRLAVRPGITGLAQVQQAPDADLFTVRRKLNYDLCYIERMSLSLDLRLILATILKCLGVPFLTIGRIVRLPKPDTENGHNSSAEEGRLASSPIAPEACVGLNQVAARG